MVDRQFNFLHLCTHLMYHLDHVFSVEYLIFSVWFSCLLMLRMLCRIVLLDHFGFCKYLSGVCLVHYYSLGK